MNLKLSGTKFKGSDASIERIMIRLSQEQKTSTHSGIKPSIVHSSSLLGKSVTHGIFIQKEKISSNKTDLSTLSSYPQCGCSILQT